MAVCIVLVLIQWVLLVNQILSNWQGDIVDSGIGLLYRPASPYVARRAGTTTLWQSRLHLSCHGLRIWPQD
jgi:hypothetical protein